MIMMNCGAIRLHGLIAGKSDPLWQDRFLDRDKGKALAAHWSLSQLDSAAISASLFYSA